MHTNDLATDIVFVEKSYSFSITIKIKALQRHFPVVLIGFQHNFVKK